MKLSNITKIFRLGTPPAVLSPERAVPLDFAFACPDCGWVLQGAVNHKCKFCESDRIVHVLSLIENIRRKAEQKFKIDTTTSAAQQRRDEHNTLAYLTAPELPPKNAA